MRASSVLEAGDRRGRSAFHSDLHRSRSPPLERVSESPEERSSPPPVVVQPVKSADSADFADSADDVVAAAVVESPQKWIGEILWQTRSFSRRVSSTN